MHPQNEEDGVGTLGSAAPRHQCTRSHGNSGRRSGRHANEIALWEISQLWTADYILQVRSELEKVAQIEGIDSLAMAAAGCCEV